MTDTTSDIDPHPAGLGGWLWPVTWATAVLPVLLASELLSALLRALPVVVRHGELPYPLSETWGRNDLLALLLMTILAWWWATGWFARDARMLRRAPCLLLACACSIFLFAWIQDDPAEKAVLAAILVCAAIVVPLCARWSKRMRNTFVIGPLPVKTIAWKRLLLGGPNDWSRGGWLLPGALLSAALLLSLQVPFFTEAALQTIPPLPPPPKPVPHDSGNAAAALALMGHFQHPGRYIEASRIASALSLFASLLVICAVIGLARGARSTVRFSLVALALGMAAPLWMDTGDRCCPFHYEPPQATMWQPWFGLLIFATVNAFKRHRSATPPVPARQRHDR
jgi:hypothetical protein